MQHHFPRSISFVHLSLPFLSLSHSWLWLLCVLWPPLWGSLARTSRTQQPSFVGTTTFRAGTQAYPLPDKESARIRANRGGQRAGGLQLKMAIKRGNSLTIGQFTRHKQNEQHRADNFQHQLQFAFSHSSGQNVHVTFHHAFSWPLFLSFSPCLSPFLSFAFVPSFLCLFMQLFTYLA